MSEPMATRTVIVANRAGLHVRSALLVANLVRGFRAKVELVKDRQRANANDMIEMLSLGAAQGEQLVVEATGEEAEGAVEALARLFAEKFHEDDMEGPTKNRK